jgi:hypothetical protein
MAEFTDYALWKMAQRGIDRDDVELVLADPEGGFQSREEPYRFIYSRHIGGRLLYAVVEPDDHECVVNAFWP